MPQAQSQDLNVLDTSNIGQPETKNRCSTN